MYNTYICVCMYVFIAKLHFYNMRVELMLRLQAMILEFELLSLVVSFFIPLSQLTYSRII